MANGKELERALETIASPGFGRADSITVPRALLETVADLLEVLADDAPCPKDSFPEDAMLALGQVKAFLK